MHDTIGLTGLAYKASDKAVWTRSGSGGALKIENTANADVVVATLELQGSYVDRNFKITKIGATGMTDIIFVPTPAATSATIALMSTDVFGQSGGDFEWSASDRMDQTFAFRPAFGHEAIADLIVRG